MSLPIFDSDTKTLEEFDHRLPTLIDNIRGRGLRTLFHTGVDGTATKPTWDPANPELVDDFLENCEALYENGVEVGWICRRGVNLGPGNLVSLRKHHYYIRITGCDGNETYADGNVEHFTQSVPFLDYRGQLDDLKRIFNRSPISIVPMGYSILVIFIKQDDIGYRSFETMMSDISDTMGEGSIWQYCTIPRRNEIALELVHAPGKVSAVHRARESDNGEIGLEIYTGSDQADILAMQEVNSQPNGFAYKVYSDRDQLNTDAASGPNVLYYLSGFIDGSEQLSRLMRMIAERLRSAD